ncbi:hypothetical protein OAU50_08920, partial [Planctomycetota bacterium]|nr:hypothetical protein [Planctomycetota bacterium]
MVSFTIDSQDWGDQVRRTCRLLSHGSTIETKKKLIYVSLNPPLEDDLASEAEPRDSILLIFVERGRSLKDLGREFLIVDIYRFRCALGDKS